MRTRSNPHTPCAIWNQEDDGRECSGREPTRHQESTISQRRERKDNNMGRALFQGNLYIATLSTLTVVGFESSEMKRYVSWHDQTHPELCFFVDWALSSIQGLLVGSLFESRGPRMIRPYLPSRQIHIAHGVWGWSTDKMLVSLEIVERYARYYPDRDHVWCFILHTGCGGAFTEFFWAASTSTAVRGAIRDFISHMGWYYDQLISPAVTMIYYPLSLKTSIPSEFGLFNLAHGTHIYL